MPHSAKLVMNQLKQIHAYTLRNGIIDQNKVLIVQLLQIPNIPYARNVFDQIPHPNIFLYNKLIQAYSSQNQPHQCLSLYTQMRLKNCAPNQHSFIFLFTAFASLHSLFYAQILHTQFVKSGFQCDVFASTALVDMYAKLRRLTLARKAFDEMQKGIRPNEVTIASVMPACSNLGALEFGERIEKYAREYGFFNNIYVSNAVLEMYARCGRIDVAKKMFNEIGKRRNLCTWNSMITGLAVHGKCNEALELYEQMLREGTAPDDVTFVGLILACTHGGMILYSNLKNYVHWSKSDHFIMNIEHGKVILEKYVGR
ncbi:hypothetical protein QYF36_012102 [Acer negundo]|nr:hypothetical protein QYF36_012102 [Acer negundo]